MIFLEEGVLLPSHTFLILCYEMFLVLPSHVSFALHSPHLCKNQNWPCFEAHWAFMRSQRLLQEDRGGIELLY